MGYTTYFSGSLRIEPELPEAIVQYINAFRNSRRMERRGLPTHIVQDPEFVLGDRHLGVKRDGNGHFMVEQGYGTGGEFYVGEGSYDSWKDSTVVQPNAPASTQPGLWCQWMIDQEGGDEHGQLRWDYGEKFYNYVEWLKYLIDNVFVPNGHVLNGDIDWQGEEIGDIGTIEVVDNIVSVHEGYLLSGNQPSIRKHKKVVECYQCGERYEVVFDSSDTDGWEEV